MKNIKYSTPYKGLIYRNEGGEFTHKTFMGRLKSKMYRFAKKSLTVIAVVMAVLVFGGVCGIVGVKADQATLVQIQGQDPAIPVLNRIAQCESSNSNLAANGQVLIHWNKGGTVDIGKYAINEQIWGKQATKLGYDLTKPADNLSFALWLYHNVGTSPWVDSENCWSK